MQYEFKLYNMQNIMINKYVTRLNIKTDLTRTHTSTCIQYSAKHTCTVIALGAGTICFQ